MDTVNIEKQRLLAVVTENRELHAQVYSEAMEGWKEAMKDWFIEGARIVADGGTPERLAFTEVEPQNHSDDYDQIITMLEMSVDEVIELEDHQFAQYVMDRWNWKRAWIQNSSKFSQTASTSSNYR